MVGIAKGTASPWTEELKERLSQLWNAGTAIKQIARELGVSRDAVTSKRKELGLAARTQPAKITTASRAEPLARGASTLPPLPSLRR